MACQGDFRQEPLAFFLTWTAYASWLPGDTRGWADKSGVLREPNTRLRTFAASLADERPLRLDPRQRGLVASVIVKHCNLRGWSLLAVSCREQHVHVVVAATNRTPSEVSRQLKAWTARGLGQSLGSRRKVWTRRCSCRRIFDERSLSAVVTYVTECQEQKRS